VCDDSLRLDVLAVEARHGACAVTVPFFDAIGIGGKNGASTAAKLPANPQTCGINLAIRMISSRVSRWVAGRSLPSRAAVFEGEL
jgi:hypothetical protein